MAPSKKNASKFPAEEYAFLTQFEGIGKVTAEKLLNQFGNTDAVFDAGADKLQDCIGEVTGMRLFRQMHGQGAPLKNKPKSKFGRNPIYNTKLGEAIAKDYAEGTGTIVEIMEKHGLSEQTFYNWKQEYLEFFELIKKAEQMRRGRKKEMALNGLKKLLEGYEVTEQQTTSEPYTDEDGRQHNKVKNVTISRKHITPSSTMIIFTLCNVAPDEFKSVQHVKYEGAEEPPPYDFSSFSDEELEQFEELSKKALNGSSQ